MASRLEIRDRGKRLVLAGQGARRSALSCTFSLELTRTPDRLERCGGQLSRREEPGAPDGEQALVAMERLAARYQDRLALRYERVSYRRTVSYDDEPPQHSEADVWALTGSIKTENGHELPIGWSGRQSDLLTSGMLHDRAAWLAETLGHAVPGKSGTQAVLLSTQAAAVLLHEAVGHFAEAAADVPGGLSHRIGTRLGTEMLMVRDDPTAEDGCTRYAADDEAVGTVGPTELVRNGVLVAQLHSRDSAKEAGTLPTANARAATGCRPLPRMSNLICTPGGDSSEALAERVWRGLLVHHLCYGYGVGREVGARVVLAEHIERGRRTGRYVTGLRIETRNDLFTRAIGFGDRAETNPNAMCGKAGQILFDIGTTAPEIALSSLELVA